MNQVREQVVQAFDSWSDLYDEAAAKAEYFAPGWISRHFQDLDCISECRVLDLGCGTGLNIKALCEVRAGVRADGIDASPGMLEHARATGRYERLSTHDLHKGLSETPSGIFDLVIVFGVLELLADMTVCLSECHRVLKPNGTLWASFKRFEADDEASPPRHTLGRGIALTGYSAAEILHMMKNLSMGVIALEPVIGYITRAGFGCPFYVLTSRKTSA